MKFLLFFSLVLMAITVSAQSPFKPLKKPEASYSLSFKNSLKTDTTAFRFTPMAGYNISTEQLMAGVGYGLQWLHFDQTTQKYYCDFSVQAVGWFNGGTASSSPDNIGSYGLTIGFLNQKIQVGTAYTPTTKKFGVVVNVAAALNN